MNVRLIQSRDITLFLPIIQDVELGDRFLLSMLHWCGIGKRASELQLWEVYLAMDDAIPVGVCGLYQNPAMPPHLAWLSWLGIRKSFRHRGVGSAMLASLVNLAQSKHRFSELWVYTDAHDISIHQFYERAGFQFVGDGKNVAPDVVMSPTDKVFRRDLAKLQH
jgi:GNAT superfamily N-acetyltransferase